MIRFGHGFDAHRLVAGRRLILGGVDVPFERGALGHSDADALAHAVADALLGSLALGDLGAHFPDSDSLVLLAACVDLVRERGYRVGNIDATIVVERPRLATYTEQMRCNLAARCGVDASAVSVKAKSSEGMGYTGDGTGIAVYAVASVEKIEP